MQVLDREFARIKEEHACTMRWRPSNTNTGIAHAYMYRVPVASSSITFKGSTNNVRHTAGIYEDMHIIGRGFAKRERAVGQRISDTTPLPEKTVAVQTAASSAENQTGSLKRIGTTSPNRRLIHVLRRQAQAPPRLPARKLAVPGFAARDLKQNADASHSPALWLETSSALLL